MSAPLTSKSHLTPGPARFKSNPVEWVLLFTLLLVLGGSVYRLFGESSTFRPVALVPMASSPVREGRTPASLQDTLTGFVPRLQHIELNCKSDWSPQETSASKFRLSGGLCLGSSTDFTPSAVTQLSIINDANKYRATVFVDSHSSRFSTDYIPVNLGENPIQFQFKFLDGTQVSRQLLLRKKENL